MTQTPAFRVPPTAAFYGPGARRGHIEAAGNRLRFGAESRDGA